MAVVQPSFIPVPFAENGDKDTVPASTAATGRATWNEGFPEETSTPIASGGVPPHRLDFQGVLNLISKHLFFEQSGSLYTWDASLDYVAGAHVLGSDGKEYVCISANGVSGTVQNPTTDTSKTYWKQVGFVLADFIYPVGSIYMSVAATNPGTLFGGTWERIQGRFLLGASSSHVAGETGGAESRTITVANMPSHSHTGTLGNAGSHAHTRGTMDITGSFSTEALTQGGVTGTPVPTGAFFPSLGPNSHIASYTEGGNYYVNFSASRTWTGATSTEGTHSHSVTVSNTGSGSPLSTMPPYLSVYIWKRTA